MATYYVNGATGSDSNPGTLASPFLTIGFGLSVLVAGDTLNIRTGTYNEAINETQIVTGTLGSPITVRNYLAEVVTLRPTATCKVLRLETSARSYLIFQGLIFDQSLATCVAEPVVSIDAAQSNIILQSCEVKEGVANGLNIAGSDHTVTNLTVHDCAGDGIFIEGTGNILNRSIAHSNTGNGIVVEDDCKVFNCLAYENTLAGIRVANATGVKIFNDTSTANTTDGIEIAATASATQVKNTISYNNTGLAIDDGGTGTVQVTNLTTNPTFVAPGSNDYHLQTTSTAIDTGTDLTADGVTEDLEGHFRPTGPSFDIGAYEAFFSALDPATIFLNKSDAPVVTESITRNLNPQGTIHISVSESPVVTDRIANQGTPDSGTLNPGGMTEGIVFFSAENPKTYDLRVVEERYGANGIIEWDLVREDISVYDWVSESPLLSSLIGGGSPVPTPPEDDHSDQSQPGATRIVFLDIPTLISQHDGPGFYVAAGGISDGFAGSILYEKKGDAYTQIAELGGRAVIGIANTKLDSGPVTTFDVDGRTFVWDDTNTVDITLIDNVSTLSSVSDADMLAGSNAVALGADGRWEILSFGVATQLDAKKWRLSHLLRGLKGTEWAIDLHAVSDTFVLLNSTIKRIHDEFTDLDVARTFRAVSIGEAFGSASNRTFTDRGVSLKPLSPVFLRASEDDDQNRTLIASRRSRLDGLAGLDTYDPPPPLGETILKFEIDILDAPETTVLRTITTVHEFALYTAAQQTADFGSVPSELHLCWYQISETRGRGYAGCSVITVFDEDPPDPPSSGVDSIAILGDEVKLTGDVTVSLTGGGTLTRTGQNINWDVSTVGDLVEAIEFVIDGGATTITTGSKGYLEVPFACTINRVTMLADQSGSIVVDIRKVAYADYDPPTAPTSGDSICAAAKPTITTATKSQDSTLTGWTISVAAGDILEYYVDSVTSHRRVTVSLKVTRIANPIDAITFIIEGGGSAITTGIKGDLEVPFDCVIDRVTLLADQSGSIVIDIWKDTYANAPPTDADSITASAPPTITTATKSQDSTLTGWTTSITAGDILRFNVDSIITCERVTLALKVTRT